MHTKVISVFMFEAYTASGIWAVTAFITKLAKQIKIYFIATTGRQ